MPPWTPVSVGLDAWRAGLGRREAIAKRQRGRLAALLRFARERSPYFRTRYKDLPDDPGALARYPVLTKSEMMAHLDDLVTDPDITLDRVEEFVSSPERIGELFLGRYLVWLTSGTTGERALIVQDSQALATYMVVGFLRGLVTAAPLREVARELATVMARGSRGAALITANDHYGGIVTMEQRRRKYAWRAKRERAFDVRAPLPETVEGLNAFQPAILGGYPSVLLSLAEEQAQGRLRIRPVLISTSAEMLEPGARQRMEAAFGCGVRDCYSAAEVGAIAFDCRYQRLHINSDWVVLEPVDEEYRPVPPGELSYTVLVTNLANRAQPIIRYDLGDRVSIAPEPCPCGSPLPVVSVVGRTGSVLTFRAADGGSVSLSPLAMAESVKSRPGVKRVQLVQAAPTELKLRVEVYAGSDEAQVWERAESGMRDYLADQGLPNVQVRRDPSPLVRDPRSGKFQMVWSEVQ